MHVEDGREQLFRQRFDFGHGSGVVRGCTTRSIRCPQRALIPNQSAYGLVAYSIPWLHSDWKPVICDEPLDWTVQHAVPHT
jgi:hypothetical protein